MLSYSALNSDKSDWSDGLAEKSIPSRQGKSLNGTWECLRWCAMADGVCYKITTILSDGVRLRNSVYNLSMGHFRCLMTSQFVVHR